MAYLYAYAGQPWRTQARLGTIMASQYAPRPDGLAGNDDLGQMSAWFVFTALGFYPVTPGSNEYVIGRPFLRRATLNLPSGKRFTVIADGLDDAHGYIGHATLDGKPLAARVPAPRRNHGRRRTALRDAGAAEHGMGNGTTPVLDVVHGNCGAVIASPDFAFATPKACPRRHNRPRLRQCPDFRFQTTRGASCWASSLGAAP
jgi:hypothetical protein